MKNKLFLLSSIMFGLAPVAVLAQISTSGTPGVSCNLATIGGILCKIGQILNSVIPVLIALGVVFFVWGVISYVVGGDEEAKKKGRTRMVYGIIGLVVIVGMWGLVRIVTNTFGLNNTGNFTLPTVPLNN